MAGKASIERLLRAEAEAQQIISKARQDKSAKLKKARDDADLEINNYKQRKMEEFQNISQAEESQAQYDELQAETQRGIALVEKQAAERRDEVINIILEKIADVHLSAGKKVEAA